MSIKNGFLPDKVPMTRLPERFEQWESTLDNLIELIKTNRLRQDVDMWRYVEPNDECLPTEPHWQRAYLVLTFIAHSILGADDAPSKLPSSLAVPWSKVSSHLKLPTVTCYAAVVLYNWGLIDPDKGATPSNLKILHLYTGTRDEEWFYLVSMFCELAAAPGIVAVTEAFSAAKSENVPELKACLSRVALSIENITKSAIRMYEACKPYVFYNEVRQFQSGFKGIVFEGVSGKPQEASGASAGQSSTIPVFDILLGVNTHEFKDADNFLTEQRKHMPGTHRDFLTELAQQPISVRDYVAKRQDAELTSSFNDCVKKLAKFRRCHKELTRKMIVEPAAKIKSASVQVKEEDGPKGTGGTDFRKILDEIIVATEKSELS